MPKVDLSHYKKREQAYVKHCLLEEYLPEWAYKVGTTWGTALIRALTTLISGNQFWTLFPGPLSHDKTNP